MFQTVIISHTSEEVINCILKYDNPLSICNMSWKSFCFCCIQWGHRKGLFEKTEDFTTEDLNFAKCHP